MRRPPLLIAGIAQFLAATLMLSTATAGAADDCPPGSVQETDVGFTWCEPTVCANDGQCGSNEVCRRVALCMEVGTLADAASIDAGKRLVVTQRCVAGPLPGDPKTCPQKQTCSDLNRCVPAAAAEKMGILESASSATPPGSAEPKKSACNCDVVGASHGGAGVVVAGFGALVLAARRRRDR